MSPAKLASAGAVVVLFPIMLVAFLGASSSGQTGSSPGSSSGLRAGSVPGRYAAWVLAAGSRCAAAPAPIIAAQLAQESGFNPRAVSGSGAEGIAQFLPSTWRSWSLTGESPFDPQAAIRAQSKFDCALAKQMTLWQAQHRVTRSVSVTALMLAGYNAGPAAVLAAGGVPPFEQTQNYVHVITANAVNFTSLSSGAAPSGGGAAPAGSFAAREIAAASKWIGTPYSFAGGNYSGPTLGVCTGGGAFNDCHIVGFDCSGLVMYAVYQASHGTIALPHLADTQTRGGMPVPRSQLRPGDLIGFTDPGAGEAHHVGIYVGQDRLLNAPESGEKVRIDSLDTAYYRGQQWRAVRYG